MKRSLKIKLAQSIKNSYSSSMGVSVCILAYNEERNIQRCLQSLVSSTALIGEILFVDCFSTDETVERVENFAKLHPQLQIRILKARERSLGHCRALAIIEANFPLVAFIDADCEAPADWLGRLLHEFQERRLHMPNLAAIGGGQVAPENTDGFYLALNYFCGSFWCSFGRSQLQSEKQSRRVYHLATCNVLYCKKDLIEVGNFNPQFKVVCEDVDLGWRLHFAGKEMLRIPDLNVVHYNRKSLVPWMKKMIRYGAGQVHLLRQHRRHLTPFLFLPCLAFFSLVIGGFLFPRATFTVLIGYLGFLVVVSVYFALRKKTITGGIYLFGLVLMSQFGSGLGEILNLIQFGWSG